jgi:glycosyltransferase involved in cell wall biosynthesis
MNNRNNSLLLVANWDSGTGYAWWLIEGFWVLIASDYSKKSRTVYLAYPSISRISKAISESAIAVRQLDFRRKDLKSVVQQCKFIREHGIGTIYFSDYPGCHWRYFLYRMSGASCIIVHDHTPGVRDKPSAFRQLLKRMLHRIPGYCTSGLIGATEYVRKRHIEVNCFPEKNCYSAPNGLLDQPVAVPVDLQKLYGIPAGRKVMVTTGRASHYKGIDFALEILSLLVNREGRHDIHYLFCGDGPDLDEFRRLADSLNIREYVTFAGRVDLVYPCLLACDFAIHPSKGEVGYSLSILEYMQAGLPVIVPDNPSVCGATITNVNGYTYRDGNITDAADKVMKLLDNPALIEKLGGQARKDVMENYKLSVTHERLLKAVDAIDQHNPIVSVSSDLQR